MRGGCIGSEYIVGGCIGKVAVDGADGSKRRVGSLVDGGAGFIGVGRVAVIREGGFEAGLVIIAAERVQLLVVVPRPVWCRKRV